MADLFGDWVPESWIREVFAACEAAPQHRYLFLTKNPQRYNELLEQRALPEGTSNFWYGGTRTGEDSDREHEASMSGHTFLSVEPILAPMERSTLNVLEMWDWIIVGAETGDRKGKVGPRKEWIDEIASVCRDTGTPIFMKSSIRELMGADFRQEFPWIDEDLQ
jgi:protein gp37